MLDRKKSLFFKVSLLALALPALAHAEAPETLETVVTITREPVAVSKLGQSIDVLTQADIRSYQSLMVADLLVRTTDLTLSRNGGPGASTAASLRGAGGDHTLYILDGVRLNDPSQVGGGSNLGLIATDDLSRIEVLRGPLSTLWGSGAMGGVVSLTSAEPSQTLEGDLRLEGFDHYGSARAAIGGKTGNLYWRVSGSTLNDQGVSAFAGGSEKDGFAQTTLNGKLRYDFSENLSLKVFATRSHSRNDYDGYPAPDYLFADTGEFGKTDTTLAVAALTHRFTSGEQTLSISETDADRNDFNSDHTPSFVANGHIQSADYHVLYRLGATRLLGGLSYERDTMRVAYPASWDPNPVPLRAATMLASVYGQVTHDFGPFDLALSARHDDASSFGTSDVAQISINAPVGDRIHLRASAGQGFKVPSLYQLYSEYGTAGLVPERSQTLDAGIDYAIGNGLLSATVFTRKVNDQIDFVYDTCTANQPYGCYGNIARTGAEGLELELTQNLGENVNLRANYTFLKTRDESSSSDRPLPRRPEQMGSADLTYAVTPSINLGFGVRYVGKSYDSAYDATPSLKAYTLADVRADYALNDRVALYGRIENAGATRYQTAKGYGQTGRRLWLGIHTKLF